MAQGGICFFMLVSHWQLSKPAVSYYAYVDLSPVLFTTDMLLVYSIVFN